MVIHPCSLLHEVQEVSFPWSISGFHSKERFGVEFVDAEAMNGESNGTALLMPCVKPILRSNHLSMQ